MTDYETANRLWKEDRERAQRRQEHRIVLIISAVILGIGCLVQLVWK